MRTLSFINGLQMLSRHTSNNILWEKRVEEALANQKATFKTPRPLVWLLCHAFHCAECNRVCARAHRLG